jgi:predicted MFS family arabinose efflux permease
MAQAARDDKGSGIFAPLRRRLFRAVWIANLVTNFGWLIQGVGAAWLMTQLDPSPDTVALVQAATQVPILLLSLIAGAAADLWDRRSVLIVAQLWVLVTSFGLAAMTWAGLTGPTLLLLFTFSLGMGAALNSPAMQVVVRELVPRRELASAVTINAVAFNLARSVGPALGGVIVALAGAEAAFLINAVSCIGLLVVLIRLRRHVREPELPRERVAGAIIAGLRYVGQTRPIQRTLVRGGVFGFGAAAIPALLPLVALELLEGGPALFGILLGVFGIGALGGAFLIHPLRHRLGAEWMVTVLSGVSGAAALMLGLLPTLPVALLALPLAGAAWLGSFSSFNIAVQLSSAVWVQARVMSLYQMAVFGMMAFGSWAWGELADAVGLPGALIGSGIWLLASLLLHLVLTLPGGQAPDLRPAPAWSKPEPRLHFDPDEGPVMVLVEYRVAIADAPAFAEAMEDVGHMRRRDGALRWQIYQDTGDAEHWVEAFTVGSWLDHLRQAQRATAADGAVEAKALRFHQGEGPPSMRRLLHRTHGV